MGNKKSSFSQSAIAQYNLGRDFHVGRNGKSYDYAQAVKYYQLAAAQGLAQAQYTLGDCYYNGNGVKKDLQEAVKYFKLAAAQGDTDAQYNLGVCYENGCGVRERLTESC